MTRDELLAAVDRMQVSLDNLARLLEVNRATLFRYARGELEIPAHKSLAIEQLEQRLQHLRKSRKDATVVDLARDLGVDLKPQQKRRR